MSTRTELMAFLDTIHRHMARHTLPAPVAVDVTTWREPVTVQLQEFGVTDLAAALLAWARSLEGVTVTVWRVPSGEDVHLSILGRVTSGMPVRVYGSCCYDPTTFPDLPRGSRQDVSLLVLRGWARGRGVAA